MPRRFTAQQARWLAIDAQGLGKPRPKGPVTRRHLRSTIGTIGALQLDAINIIERTQFLVPFSRLGAYDVRRLHEMTGPHSDLFEYWAHAACLLPVAMQPLFRWRMEDFRHGTRWGAKTQARVKAWRESEAAYVSAVLDEIRDRGPLAGAQLSDPRRRDGEWWGRRSVGRVALEHLFSMGDLAAWRTPSFERVYDLPERVFPPEVLAQPTPTIHEAHRALLLSAAGSLGVATVRDLANYYMMTGAKARVAELVDSGQLVPAAVEGWEQEAYCLPEAKPRRPTRAHATLLSPFDSLIWYRERTERVFGFVYRIEVYVPAPDRRYGYYVLPLLLGDEIVARFDLKADRQASTLRVSGAYVEPGADPTGVAGSAATELDALRGWIGLADVAVAKRGNLAPALRRAIL